MTTETRPKILQQPWFVLALLLGTTACASAPPENQGNVRFVGVTPIEEEAETEPASENGSVPEAAPLVEVPLAEVPIVEEQPAVPTTAERLSQAIDWTAEGLRYYQQGDVAAAGRHLEDAHILLLEAELPEVVQEAGPAGLVAYLPEELRHLDIQAVREEAMLRNAGEELPEHAYIAGELRRILRRFDDSTPDEAQMATIVGEVEQYVRFYQGHGRAFYEKAYMRKHKYQPTIRKVFEERGIPEELAYMAFVESGFYPRARSHANAYGTWQFIRATGRRYGLRSSEDFYDVQRATEAAAEYLLDLIGIFGSRSFLLATAAYNAGEGRIERCLRGLDDPFKGRSFWAIRPCLARETREYVPRILAAAVIGSDPRRFGFDLPTEQELLEDFDVVTIASPTSLSQVAQQAGVSVADLRTANTDMASNARSTPVRNYPLYVPRGGGERLAQFQPRPAAPTAGPRVSNVDQVPAETPASGPITYQARRGDTLIGIARRYGVTVDQLREWNPVLKQRVLFGGDRLKINPGAGGGAAPAAQSRIVYKVRKGNTLAAIAAVFNVRYRDIMRWNDLSSSRLRVGQQLTIQPSQPVRVETYRVQSGDTVARIARRFGVTVRDVLTSNGLGQRTVIRPGQRLTIYIMG